MSSVSSIGGGLYQFLQGISGNQQQPASATASSSATVTPDATQDGTSQQGVQGHHHHHHGGGGNFSKIEQAVTDALQSAQSNGNTDPNQAIQDAIEKVFQDGGNSTDPTAVSTTDPTTSTDSASASATPHQAFISALQAHGVDPQQFHQDFMAAIEAARNGQSDPSTAFKSFPPGSTVDENA